MSSDDLEDPSAQDHPLDAAGMLRLLEDQRRSVERQMGGFVPLITGAWGLAWSIGFVALWLIDGVRPAFALPLPVAVAVFVAAMLFGIGVSAWFGIRSSRGIRTTAATAFTGAVYGVTWSIGGVALAVLGAGLIARGMSPELANYYYPSAYVLFAGIMYLVAGAIWHAVPAAITGAVLVIVAVVAPFFPYPLHYLFFAVAGGGSFLLLSLVSYLYLRRAKTLVSGSARHA